MVLPKLPTVRAKRDFGTALSEINVTPFVDVMLVLLVIFMVTTPLMQSGIGVDLPQAETDTAPAEEGLRMTVQPTGTSRSTTRDHQRQPPREPAPERLHRQDEEDRLSPGRQEPPLRLRHRDHGHHQEGRGRGHRADDRAPPGQRQRPMTPRAADNPLFKRAIIWSAAAHSLLLAADHHQPRPAQAGPKANFHYIPISLMGGRRRHRRPGRRRGGASAPSAQPRSPSRTSATWPCRARSSPSPSRISALRRTSPKRRRRKRPPDKKAAIEARPLGQDRRGQARNDRGDARRQAGRRRRRDGASAQA